MWAALFIEGLRTGRVAVFFVKTARAYLRGQFEFVQAHRGGSFFGGAQKAAARAHAAQLPPHGDPADVCAAFLFKNAAGAGRFSVKIENGVYGAPVDVVKFIGESLFAHKYVFADGARFRRQCAEKAYGKAQFP